MTPFAEPIRATRTFEAAIEHVVEGIERNRLRTGDRIPNESELSALLGISKPTLRQALRVLERSGVIEVRQGKGGGIFVASDLVPFDAISGAVALEESAVVELLQARRVLEGAVTRFAADVATDEDYRELERTIVLLNRHLGDRPAVMRADAMFHRAVVRAAHNFALQAAMRALARDLASLRDAYSGGIEQDRRTLDVHRRQLQAMRSGDHEALDGVLDEHFSMLEEAFAPGLGRSRDSVFSPS